MNRSLFPRRWLLLLILIGVLNALRAQDQAPPVPQAESPATPAQVIALSSSVTETLKQGEVSPEVLQQQQKIVDSLRAMLGGARSQSGEMPEPVSSSRPGTIPSENKPGTGTSQGASPSSGSSPPGAESSGLPAGQSPENLGDLKRREGLADAVWGHLPPRIRDELYRSYTERYVPEYDSLLRRYFEKLAESAPGNKPDR